MEITGKIIAVLEPRGGVSQRTGNSWKSQEYVIETVEQYPKKCVFNVFGEDNITRYNIQVGQMLTVSFDINAREWNGRWFNDIRAWNVAPAAEPQPVADPMAGAPVGMPVQPAVSPAPAATAAPEGMPGGDPFAVGDGSTDNLPF